MKLSDDVSQIPLVGPAYELKLKKLGINTVEDLLLHIPSRYVDLRNKTTINKANINELVAIEAKIQSFQNLYTKKGMAIQLAKAQDETGEINILWFNQRYLYRNIEVGKSYIFSGEISWYKAKKALMSPDFEVSGSSGASIHTGRIVPIYSLTKGLSSKWLRRKIYEALQNTDIKDPLSEKVLSKLNLTDYRHALNEVHFPSNMNEASNARRRLAFNELYWLQVNNRKRIKKWRMNTVPNTIQVDNEYISNFIKSLPFNLTNSQNKATQEILQDLNKSIPMNRLLEGDVGSGKTVVAIIASLAIYKSNLKTILMAPTQILASQHFDTFNKFLSPLGVKVGQITSEIKPKKMEDIDIYVGTHALISKNVSFNDIGLIVIDEQHRFGVKQRLDLAKKGKNENVLPHILNMTATPIPRTVAHTFYGDLDLSILDELPAGRQKITTWIVPPEKRDKAYSWIEQKVKKDKSQAYIVCPLIEEADTANVPDAFPMELFETPQEIKAATKEYSRLKNIFTSLDLELMHGKVKKNQKEKILTQFKRGDTNILVCTPIIEVGIDVANATIMAIESADRFGLSQLHQLRGRVGRGEKKSYCLLFTESKSEKVEKRLSILKETISGFRLAELDLEMRGPGEIFGVRQHGIPELKIASWKDEDLIKLSRDLAEETEL